MIIHRVFCLNYLQASVTVVFALGEGQDTLVLIDVTMPQEKRSHDRRLVIDIDEIIDNHLQKKAHMNIV